MPEGDLLLAALPDTPAPLDLLLFNDRCDAFGAHVAVFLGDDGALHLAKSLGYPAIWPLARFATERRCSVLVGIKRVTRRTAASRARLAPCVLSVSS